MDINGKKISKQKCPNGPPCQKRLNLLLIGGQAAPFIIQGLLLHNDVLLGFSYCYVWSGQQSQALILHNDVNDPVLELIEV